MFPQMGTSPRRVWGRTSTHLVVHAREDDATEFPELRPEVRIRLHRPVVQIVIILYEENETAQGVWREARPARRSDVAQEEGTAPGGAHYWEQALCHLSPEEASPWSQGPGAPHLHSGRFNSPPGCREDLNEHMYEELSAGPGRSQNASKPVPNRPETPRARTASLLVDFLPGQGPWEGLLSVVIFE